MSLTAARSVDTIFNSFVINPHENVITGPPNAQNLLKVYQDVQRNATNITTPLSTHGCLFEAIGLAAFHQQYPNEAHVTVPTHPGDLPRGSTFDFPERQARHNDAIAAWTDHANAQIALSRYILTVCDDEYVRAYLQTGDKAPAPWMLFEYLTRDYVALTLTAQDIEGVKVGMLREIKLSSSH